MSLNACDWLRLEDMVKKLRKMFPELQVDVISGVAFLPKTEVERETGRVTYTTTYKHIGSHRMAVPTHLFKVVAMPPTRPLIPHLSLLHPALLSRNKE